MLHQDLPRILVPQLLPAPPLCLLSPSSRLPRSPASQVQVGGPTIRRPFSASSSGSWAHSLALPLLKVRPPGQLGSDTTWPRKGSELPVHPEASLVGLEQLSRCCLFINLLCSGGDIRAQESEGAPRRPGREHEEEAQIWT